MNIEKTLKNVGRGLLGIVLAGTVACSIPTAPESESKLPIPQGDVQGTVLYPTVENNQVVLRSRNNADIYIDGVEKGVSDSNGNFYISDVGQGFREFKARYNKDYLANATIFVVRNQLNDFPDIQMNPTSPSGEIVWGTIYTDSTKESKYEGQLNLVFSYEPKSTLVSSDGRFAFKGYVDDAQLMAGSKRVKFFDTVEPYTIDLGENWIVDLEGYVEFE